MDKCTVFIGSMTLAMKARGILQSNGFSCELAHIHRASGCGYGLRMDCTLVNGAEKFLGMAGIRVEK